MSCPFASASASADVILHAQDSNVKQSSFAGGVIAQKKRVIKLYEDYIHLKGLSEIWDNPVTENPDLEPSFVAAFHSIELCFLLLADFISDKRTYVSKRPRVEMVANDIRQQCILLTDIVDGELEEEGVTTPATLTQNFPFPACPPTTPQIAHSPGVERMIEAVQGCIGGMALSERNSLVKLVLNVTNAFDSAFSRWTVGLGIEPHLNALRAAVGLPEKLVGKARNLDYARLIKPEVVLQTLIGEVYNHKEDFFFRTVHLGTECWAMIVADRLRAARIQADAGRWHLAAARVSQAARILHYLGDHVLMLTSMATRDYLLLKIELAGTSGEGSQQVRAFRGLVKALLHPLVNALMTQERTADLFDCDKDEEGLEIALMELYENPDHDAVSIGMWNYAKSLEDVETALLGGFYFKHFCVATNVLGMKAKGTNERPVATLKATYEIGIFPILDSVRSSLGAKMDAELAHLKGRMMDALESKWNVSNEPVSNITAAATIAGSPLVT